MPPTPKFSLSEAEAEVVTMVLVAEVVAVGLSSLLSQLLPVPTQQRLVLVEL